MPVEHCLGYLERMEKILVDDAYKKVFYDWVNDNINGLKIEFTSKPPTEKDGSPLRFVTVKWRCVNERTFGWFNRTGDPVLPKTPKDYKKTVESAKAWILCKVLFSLQSKINL